MDPPTAKALSYRRNGSRLRSEVSPSRGYGEPGGQPPAQRGLRPGGRSEKGGFEIIREREHISLARQNPDGTRTPLTMPNHSRLKASTLRTARSPELTGSTSWRLIVGADPIPSQ